MPANQKHLTKSPLHKILKIITGFVGGYYITELLFLLVTFWVDTEDVLFSLEYIGVIVWCVLFILAFIPKSGWRVFGTYLFIIGVLWMLAVTAKNYIN